MSLMMPLEGGRFGLIDTLHPRKRYLTLAWAALRLGWNWELRAFGVFLAPYNLFLVEMSYDLSPDEASVTVARGKIPNLGHCLLLPLHKFAQRGTPKTIRWRRNSAEKSCIILHRHRYPAFVARIRCNYEIVNLDKFTGVDGYR